MTGLVAVIAHDHRSAVAEAEIAALAAIYTSLLGAGVCHAAGVEPYARLIKIDSPDADQTGIQVDANGWAAVAGTVYEASR